MTENSKDNKDLQDQDDEKVLADSFKAMVFKELFSQEDSLKETAVSLLGPSAENAEITLLLIRSVSCEGVLVDEMSFLVREKDKKDCLVLVSYQSEMNKAIEKQLKDFLVQSMEKYHSLFKGEGQDSSDLETPKIRPFAFVY